MENSTERSDNVVTEVSHTSGLSVKKYSIYFCVLLILILALGLRFHGLDWDQGTLVHPDERAILMCVHDLGQDPSYYSSQRQCGTEETPWNPSWFPYGSLPIYLLKGATILLSPVVADLDLHDTRIIGRSISAIADTVTVLIIFLLGSQLYNRRVGVLAAFLASIAVIQIQLAHFYSVDTLLTLFTVGSIYFSVRVAKYGKLIDSVLAGVLIGLALGTKISVMPLLLPLAIGHAWWTFKVINTQNLEIASVSLIRGIGFFLLSLTGIITTLFLVAPYYFLDWSKFIADVGAQQQMVTRSVDLPYTRQYVDTLPYWYHIKQLSLFGLGIPLGIISWGAFLLAIYRLLRRPYLAEVLILAWLIPYFLINGSFAVKFLRYLLPMVPLMLILGSRELVIAWEWSWARKSLVAKAGLVTVAIAISSAGLYALAYQSIYTRPHTAVRMAEHIRENIPRDSLILKEHWEEGLPGLSGYRIGELQMYERDNDYKAYQMAEKLSSADYLVFYSNRLYSTIPSLPERYPMSKEYYRLLFNGDLGYELVHFETSYPTLIGVALVDDTFAKPGLESPPLLSEYNPSPISINLGWADESFSVYDHPKTLLFRNTKHVNQEEIESLLQSHLGLDSRAILPAMYTADQWHTQQVGANWSNIVQFDSWTNKYPVIAWLLALELISLFVLPLMLVVGRSLPDRGYMVAKILGLLCVSYLTWLASSLELLPFSRNTIYMFIGIMGLVSAVTGIINREYIVKTITTKWHVFLTMEAVFLIAFVVFYTIRLANPDLWHPYRGGEKPMDFAYLNAVIRSTYMPPIDPWFAGGFLNYYYFGQFMVASLIKFTGIQSSFAYNLAVPTFFAASFGLAVSLVYNMAEATRRARGLISESWSPIMAGLLGGMFVCVLGNLDGAIQLIQGISAVATEELRFPAFDFWRSTRMMPPDPPGNEITEFPFFTFLFADLHAHLIAIPLTIASLIIGLSLLLRSGVEKDSTANWVKIMLLALTIGALRSTNTWDYPTYIVIGIVVVVLGERVRRETWSVHTATMMILKSTLLVVLSIVFFLPYLNNFHAFYSSIKFSDWSTPLYQYIGINGLFIFIVITFLIKEGWGPIREAMWPALPETSISMPRGNWLVANRDRWLLVGIALLVLIFSLSVIAKVGYPTVAFIFPLGFVAVVLGTHYIANFSEQAAVGIFALVIILTALALGAGVDLITVEGDIDRMNTVFKFYLQSWILFGVACAYILWRMDFGLSIWLVLKTKGRYFWLGGLLIALGIVSVYPMGITLKLLFWSWALLAFAVGYILWGPFKVYLTRFLDETAQMVWLSMAILLVSSTLIYPILGTRARLADRFNVIPRTLDGTAYMEFAIYDDGNGPVDLRWERKAIQWLQENVKGSPVVLEANTGLYKWGSRISIYTGLPSIIGWDWHQVQQRGDMTRREIDLRIRDVRTIYSTLNIADALGLIESYDVGYIYVGALERNHYPAEGLMKFDSWDGTHIELVYPSTISENPDVKIYRVVSTV